MPEVLFYQLTRRSLEEALPRLLEISLARNWRVAVQTGDASRLKPLDDHLWSYDPEKFLPHGTKAEGEPETQPIYLTAEGDNPNEADARFFLHEAAVGPVLADPGAAPKVARHTDVQRRRSCSAARRPRAVEGAARDGP